MNFRLTLVQNLPNQNPSRLEVVYTFTTYPYSRSWFVDPVTSDKGVAVVTVDSLTNLLNQNFVESRVLRAHYPVAPYAMNIGISSVQTP